MIPPTRKYKVNEKVSCATVPVALTEKIVGVVYPAPPHPKNSDELPRDSLPEVG